MTTAMMARRVTRRKRILVCGLEEEMSDFLVVFVVCGLRFCSPDSEAVGFI
jgi:hypothetical protein